MDTLKSLILILTIPLVMGMSGCGSKPSSTDKVLVSFANKSITLNDFKHKLSRLPAYYQSVTDRNKKALLDDMIVEAVFYEDAVRKGIDSDKEIRELLDEARKKIIIAKFIKTEVDDKVKISDEETRKFYEEHKEEFKKPQMWRASHILVASESEAKDVLAELSKGRDFGELARERSIDATAARGGDVGYFRAGQVVPEFESTCFNLKAGETSGIVRTQFGYHIIKLTDKKDEAIEPFEEAKPMIENELKLKARKELFGRLVADLKNRYSVKVEDDAPRALEAISSPKEEGRKR